MKSSIPLLLGFLLFLSPASAWAEGKKSPVTLSPALQKIIDDEKISKEQDRLTPPPLLYNSLIAGGPIVMATVKDVKIPADSFNRTVTLDITQTLRGDNVPKTLELSYVPPRGATFGGEKRPLFPDNAWYNVEPRAGKTLLLILTGKAGSLDALCVLDAEERDAAWIPRVKKMIALETLPAATRQAALIDALSDPAPLMHSYALYLLSTKACPHDAACRQKILDRLAPVARSQTEATPQRLQALDDIGFKVYDGFSATDSVNSGILALLFSLVPDPVPDIGAEAIQILHGYLLGGGETSPDISAITIADRGNVVARLEQDGKSEKPDAQQARELLQLLTK